MNFSFTRFWLFPLFSVIAVLFFEGNVAFAKIPRSWLQEDDSEIHFFGVGLPFDGTAKIAHDAENSGVGEDLDRILRTGDSVLSFKGNEKLAGNKSQRPWYLQSIKTELGIEASGEIGLLGIEGEAAMELIWMRTPESIKKLQAEAGDLPPSPASASIEENTVALDTSMSPQQVSNKVDSVIQYLGKTKQVKHLDRVRSQLLSQAQELQGWVGQFEQVPDDIPWKPYKYQVELFIQGEGMVLPALEVGGVARIRLEWTLSKKSKPRVSVAEAATSSKNVIAPVMTALATDLETLKSLSSESDYYSLIAVKVGLGIGASGDIGIAEGKGTLIGSVFLRPDRKKVKPFQAEYSLNDGGHYGIPRDRFRSGLLKAAQMTQYVANSAERHERKEEALKPSRMFELGAIEVELALTLEGSTFLPSISKHAVMELFLMKKSRINQGASGG